MNWFKRLLSILSCLFVSKCCFAAADINSAATLAQPVQHLQNSINYAQENLSNQEQQLREIDIKISNLDQQMIQLRTTLTHTQMTLANLNKNQTIANEKLKKQQQALAKQLQLLYQIGPVSPIKLVLNQQNLQSISHELAYYHYLNTHRLQQITSIKHLLIDQSNRALAITTEQKKLTRVLALKQENEQAAQTAESKQRQLVSSLHQELANKQQQLKALLINQETLHAAIIRLPAKMTLKPMKSFSQLHHQLHWPVAFAELGSFNSLQGVGEQRLNGIIFKAPLDSPVHAVYDGKVIFAEWLRGFGLLIIIHHGHGYMSLYARNRALFAHVGDTVHTGDKIALTGNSGGYEKPSLYFEIRQNGLPVNPALWCY